MVGLNWIIRQIALIRFRLGWYNPQPGVCYNPFGIPQVPIVSFNKTNLWYNDIWIKETHWGVKMWTTYQSHPDHGLKGWRGGYGKYTCIADFSKVNCFWLLQLDQGSGIHQVQEVDVLERLPSKKRGRDIWGMSLWYGKDYDTATHIQTTFKSKWFARWIQGIHAVTFDYDNEWLKWYIDGVLVMKIRNLNRLVCDMHLCISNFDKQPDQYKNDIYGVFYEPIADIEKIKVIEQFAATIMNESEDIDEEILGIVNEKFWDLL